MRAKKLFFLLFFIPGMCYGQKYYCKKITKNIDEHKGTVTYKSPDLRDITAIKQVKTEPYFGLLLHFYDVHEHFEAKGSFVEFSDGTILKDESAEINCKQEMAVISVNSFGSSSHSGEYLLQGFFRINEENIGKFTSKRIVRVQLGDVSQKIPDGDATFMRAYIKCLRDLNQ